MRAKIYFVSFNSFCINYSNFQVCRALVADIDHSWLVYVNWKKYDLWLWYPEGNLVSLVIAGRHWVMINNLMYTQNRIYWNLFSCPQRLLQFYWLVNYFVIVPNQQGKARYCNWICFTIIPLCYCYKATRYCNLPETIWLISMKILHILFTKLLFSIYVCM